MASKKRVIVVGGGPVGTTTALKLANGGLRVIVLEGRVNVYSVTAQHVLARVKGSGEVHTVSATSWGWSCSCPARTTCSHLVAVQLVTNKPRRTP